VTLIFDLSGSFKVKSDGVNREPKCSTYKCYGRPSYLSPFSRYIWSKFWRWPLTLKGLTSGPKFTQRRINLLPFKVYHPVNPRRYIPYKRSCGQSYKQTVNDISPACLSACLDKKECCLILDSFCSSPLQLSRPNYFASRPPFQYGQNLAPRRSNWMVPTCPETLKFIVRLRDKAVHPVTKPTRWILFTADL